MTDSTKLLTLDEIAQVDAWLHHRLRRGTNYILNRVIFRLSCCCGLRVSEMCRLELGHVRVCAPPAICIEGNRRRTVPILDKGTLIDLAVYKQLRMRELGVDAPFLCSLTTNKRLTPDLVARRWKALMRVTLGKERARQLSIQAGRRTFPTYALTTGRPLSEIVNSLGTTEWTVRQYLKMAGWLWQPAGRGYQPILFATSIPLAKSRSA